MKKNWIALTLIICLVAALSPISILFSCGVANAENVDVQVFLSDESLLASFGDVFAYTNGKNIYVAKNNKILSFVEKRSFDKFIDIAMNSTHILLLAQDGEDRYLWAYKYDKRIDDISDYSYSSDANILRYLTKLYADEEGNLYAMDANKVNEIKIGSYEKAPSYFNSNTNLENGAYKEVADFAIFSDIMYCIIDGNLYAIDEQNFYYSDLSKFLKLSGEYIGVSAVNDEVLLLGADGIFKYDKSNNSNQSLMPEGLNGNSKISSAFDTKTSRRYVYAKSALNAINMYEFTDGKLEYYGCFDSTAYLHPTEYDLVKLYKTGFDVTIYSSPRHLQRLGVAPANSYLIALNQKDDFIYVYYRDEHENKAVYGYVKTSSQITLCPAETGSLGEYAQLLHDDTPIYKYPISESDRLINGSIFMQLIVIDNVGQDGDFSWGWYKVGYVDEDGKTQYGYVKQQYLSPYTQLTAPSLSKSVKLTSRKLGRYIPLYALPFEDEAEAIEVAQLAEGSSVYLKEKYNKKSDWTAVYYEGKVAYVRTKCVQVSGLTSWQIALAVTIPLVVLAAALTFVILTLAKKKKFSFRS